ncbi:MAG: hypothetical protein HXS54_09430 [Theionarchaea archaeon]|nr:hypothetical protein [Theionarchaea archaeon]
MNKKMLAALMGIAAASCVVAVTTASSLAANSPLFSIRMEQASSEKNFLPREMIRFTYSTEKGFTLTAECEGCGGVSLLDLKSQRDTECDETCFNTCPPTCDTCGSTCDGTCPYTCDDPTCPSTCSETCPSTCDYTCDDPTCAYTCEQTCHYTCEKPCIP